MLKYQRGRVIALGRTILALLFLVSIWLDPTQPVQRPEQVFTLLFYAVFALAVTAITWRDWWLDARLAAPIHAFDMVIFTAIVFSTDTYTSPFFVFFLLPLLSAAIRWGWRETAATATGLIILYLAGGLLIVGTHDFGTQRFIVRSAHLLILSAVFIWFGVHQRFNWLSFGVDELDRRLNRDEEPLPQALEFAMGAVRARSGALLIGAPEAARTAGIGMTLGQVRAVTAEGPLVHEAAPVILFDVQGEDRALSRGRRGWYRFSTATKMLDGGELRRLGASRGFVTEVRTRTRSGWLVLWDIPDLSVDFLDLGVEVGRAAGAVLDHDALLSAIEEGAAARTRLSLARDVHDSVVQFLAGAAFRVEAMMRGSRTGGEVEADLKELKRLLIEEQSEIRAFISALRRDRELELSEAVDELTELARRLGEQWSVECEVESSNDAASIPIRLQLDLQQLLREAVANAVRHGGASRIEVDVGVEDDLLKLRVRDNGSGFGPANGSPVEPWSLKERVDRAHGSLALNSRPGSTNILITLPLTGVAA